MKNLTFKRIMSFVVIAAMLLAVLAVSAVAEDAKFDLVIEGPDSFTAGDEIEVFVKVKNITATDGTLNGLTSIAGTLWYDNSRMVLTNELDASNSGSVVCMDTVPHKSWKNASQTETIYNEEEDTYTSKNSGWIDINVYTGSKKQDYIASTDDSVILKFTFKVNNTAYGDIELFFDTDVTGATVDVSCVGNGSNKIIADPTYVPPVSDDTSEETSEPEDTTPDYAYIDIDRFNVYGGSNEITAWSGEDETWSVEQRYAENPGAKTFEWLNKAYLQYDVEKELWVCVDTEEANSGCNRYEIQWQQGYGRMIIMAHSGMVTDVHSYECIRDMQAGDEFYLISFPGQEPALGEDPSAPRESTYDATLFYAGYVDMALIAADAIDNIPEGAEINGPEYPEDVFPYPVLEDVPVNPDDSVVDTPNQPTLTLGEDDFFVNRINSYIYEPYESAGNEVFAWASTEETTVETMIGAAGGATFQWFYKALLEYDEETNKFVVTDVEAMGEGANRYETEWKLGPGKIIVMTHDTNTLPGKDKVIALTVGESFSMSSNIEDLYTAAGKCNVYFTVEELSDEELDSIPDDDTSDDPSTTPEGDNNNNNSNDPSTTPEGDNNNSNDPSTTPEGDNNTNDDDANDDGDNADDNDADVEDDDADVDADENNKPETGDASSALVLVVLSLVSLAGSAVVVKARK